MKLRDNQVRGLLIASEATQAEEIDCEAFLGVMAEYAEVRVQQRPLPSRLVAAREHERLCANCREECAALTAMLDGSTEE